jgi:hypothetical protein
VEIAAYPDLPREVRADPVEALVGGTEVHRRLAGEAGTWLAPGGWLILEIGEGQAAEVRAILDRPASPELRSCRTWRAGTGWSGRACRDRRPGPTERGPGSTRAASGRGDPGRPAGGVPDRHGDGARRPSRRPGRHGALFAAKERPAELALPVLCADVASAWTVAEAPSEARTLGAAFWPGALTLVLANRAQRDLGPRALAGDGGRPGAGPPAGPGHRLARGAGGRDEREPLRTAPAAGTRGARGDLRRPGRRLPRGRAGPPAGGRLGLHGGRPHRPLTAGPPRGAGLRGGILAAIRRTAR